MQLRGIYQIPFSLNVRLEKGKNMSLSLKFMLVIFIFGRRALSVYITQDKRSEHTLSALKHTHILRGKGNRNSRAPKTTKWVFP